MFVKCKMFLEQIIWVFLLISYSSAILTPLANEKNSDGQNKSDLYSSNRLNTKREGIYSYYSKPHYSTHPSHSDTEYNNIYETNNEYEDNSYQHLSSYPSTAHHDTEEHKDLAIKALFAPLFGIALLGVVAAMINNPVLLQLGVLSGRRRRKRRGAAINNDLIPVMVPQPAIDKLHNDLMMIGHILSQMPRSNLINEEKKFVESYFMCSELGKSIKGDESCFKRLVCELWNENSSMKMVSTQKALIKKILADILNNDYVQNGVRRKIKDAQWFGVKNGQCNIYKCNIRSLMQQEHLLFRSFNNTSE